MGKGMRAGKKPSTGMGGGSMQKQMQQMQAMQRKMEAIQAEVEQKEIVKLEIKPEVCDPDDVEMLQDLIIVAVNEGLRQIDEISNAEMSKLTGGLGIPGLGF